MFEKKLNFLYILQYLIKVKMIGRLILSDRNIFKIKSGTKYITARKCNILSEIEPDTLVKSNKDFNTKDEYIKFDPNTNTIIEGLGHIGTFQADNDIYYHLFTNGWISKTKYAMMWNEYINTNPPDLAIKMGFNRINYSEQVITIDPENSIDLDDGFSFNFDNNYWYLDIHIADPVSWYDFEEPKFKQIFMELSKRIQSCYIKNTFNIEPTHLLPIDIVKLVSLLEIDASTKSKNNIRAISFQFVINKHTKTIESFNLTHTNLTNIKNYTYATFDEFINQTLNLKIELVDLCNKLRDIIGLSKDLYENIDRTNDITHKMIELFMILTNWYGGNYLKSKLNKSNFIIRIQDKKDFIDEHFDIIPIYAKPYLSVSANYAYYTKTENKNHHSLGIKNYTHLTSPMRRFIDMLNHIELYNISNIDSNIDLEKINLKIKNQKKISNCWKLFEFLESIKSKPELNKFKACLFDWTHTTDTNKINCLIVIYQKEYEFSSIINVELPQIIQTQNLTKYMEWDIELYYNSNNFKSSKFPFSIKIL